jgi:programmed cell death protein 5
MEYMDEELEKLRKKRMQEIQQQISEEDEEKIKEQQQKEFEDQKKQILRKILTTDARERLGRIKVARPEMVDLIENQLIMLAQSGELKNKINDEQLRMLLLKIVPKKRDIKIKRR